MQDSSSSAKEKASTLLTIRDKHPSPLHNLRFFKSNLKVDLSWEEKEGAMIISSLPSENASFLYHVRDVDAHVAAYALEVIGARPTQNITVTLAGVEASFRLTAPIVALIQCVLEEVAQSHAVGVLALEGDLSLAEAATILDMSEAQVIKLLDAGALPSSRDLGVRRPLLKGVLAYKDPDDTKATSNR
jgi:hypothetical protein